MTIINMILRFDVAVLCELPGVAYSTSLSWDEGRTKPHVQINCWVTSNGKGKAAASNFLDLASASCCIYTALYCVQWW